MITILQITYFLALVEHMNFSKTAEALYISQPALSKQISNFERELGFQIFNRKGTSIELNSHGKQLYVFFEKSKEEYDRVIKEIKLEHGLDQIVLNIAFLSGWEISGYIFEAYEHLRSDYPNLQIHIESGGFEGLSSKFKDGSVDIVLSLANNFDLIKNAELTHITDIQRYIVCARSKHGKESGLEVADFRDAHFYVFANLPEESKLEIIRDMRTSLGFEPKIVEVSNIESMMLNVEAGRGVAIFDAWNRIIKDENLEAIDTQSTHKIFAGYRRSNDDRMTQAFIHKLIEVLDKKIHKKR